MDDTDIVVANEVGHSFEDNELIYEEMKPVTTVMARITSRMSSMRKWMGKQLSKFCCFCQP